MKIKVRPEGREGIYLIDKKEALKIIASRKGKIHNLIGGGGLQIGADWGKQEVRDFLNKAEKIAIMIEPNRTIRHHLVALTNSERYSFDIGEITKKDLLTPNRLK